MVKSEGESEGASEDEDQGLSVSPNKLISPILIENHTPVTKTIPL